MKFTSVIVALASTGVVLAQTYTAADIPACAQACFVTAIAASGCSVSDTVCQCTTGKAALTASVTPCLIEHSTCSTSDLGTVQTVTNGICQQATGASSGLASSTVASSSVASSSMSSSAAAVVSTAATSGSASSAGTKTSSVASSAASAMSSVASKASSAVASASASPSAATGAANENKFATSGLVLAALFAAAAAL